MEYKSRQVTGSMAKGEGTVPPIKGSLSTDAGFVNEVNRGIKFDDPCHDITKETPMPEAHSSSDN
jgi:hypothetical protein